MARGVDAALHGVADHTAPIEIVSSVVLRPATRPSLIHREELALNTWAPLVTGLVPQPQPRAAVPHEFRGHTRLFHTSLGAICVIFWLTKRRTKSSMKILRPLVFGSW